MKNIFALLLLVVVTACSHPLEIIGEGDITTDALSTRGCSFAEFQASAKSCTENLVVGAYNETYYAQPAAGWDFFGWQNYCLTEGSNQCDFEGIGASTVFQFWGETVPPLRAVFHPGTSFNWRFTEGASRGTDNFTQTVGGITATVRAYVAEWNGSDYTIYGPFPTTSEASTTSAVQDGLYRNSSYDGLFFEAGPIAGIPVSGIDGGRGFGNFNYYTPAEAQTIGRFEFAVVTFSQSIDLAAVWIHRIVNHGRDFWLATGSTSPDFNLDFSSAMAGFSTSLHKKNDQQMDDPVYGATGLVNTHHNFTTLIIGAPLGVEGESLPGLEDIISLSSNFVLRHITVRPAGP